MDAWGWEQLRPWLTSRRDLPVGLLFCVIDGPTRGRPWSSAAVRVELRRLASLAGVRRRFAPHQLRHAHAVELAREGVPLNIIQRQLGHANLGTTSVYDPGSWSAVSIVSLFVDSGVPTQAAVALPLAPRASVGAKLSAGETTVGACQLPPGLIADASILPA